MKFTSLLALIAIMHFVFTGCSGDDMPVSGKFPEISLKNTGGQMVKLDYQEELLLLVFWATWCQPCIMEIPSLNETNRKYRSKGLRVVSILTDDPGLQVIRNIANRFEINYEILLGSETTASQFGIMAFPTTFMIAKGGKLVDKIMGMAPHDLLESRIQFHLPK